MHHVLRQAREIIAKLKSMISEKLYGFKYKTVAMANRTLSKIDKFKGASAGKIKGLVSKMKGVHAFLECVCEIPSAMTNIRDILGKWGPLVDLIQKMFPDLIEKLKGIIKRFEKPMKKTMKIVEKVRDVVGTLTKTAEQAVDFDSIKNTIVKLLQGACARSTRESRLV